MFVNYGDNDFFEYGALIDAEHDETEVQVLYCRPFDDSEDKFLFADCFVDASDPWIDREAVESFAGRTNDPALFALNCIEYYGVENFSSPYEGFVFDREAINEKLRHYLIASDNLNITW